MAKEEKNNKTNGKANGTKIIPKDVWKEFAEFWDKTEWEALKAADIKKLLGKYLMVSIPKDITNKDIGKVWFDQIKEFREKGKGFGGYTICFAGQTATLEKVFGKSPLNPAEMTKCLHLYINDHHLSSTSKTKGKNTIKVNTVEEMEKEVAKLNGKKGK